MSRIDHIFASLRAEGRTALMPFITAGHPTLEATEQTLPALERAGASIVELGIPFSDPIADGPVIAASMHAALTAGVTPAKILAMVKRVRPSIDLGLVAMVSCSIVERRGGREFVDACADAGFDGLIVPDIDLDAAADLRDHAAARDLGFSLLVAPTTAPARVERIAQLCRGFVYLLARAGVTGEQSDAPQIEPSVEAIRRHTDLPIAVGFGISGPAHVEAVTRLADAAIVGSALVRRMGDAPDPVAAAETFVRELAGGLAGRLATREPAD